MGGRASGGGKVSVGAIAALAVAFTVLPPVAPARAERTDSGLRPCHLYQRSGTLGHLGVTVADPGTDPATLRWTLTPAEGIPTTYRRDGQTLVNQLDVATLVYDSRVSPRHRPGVGRRPWPFGPPPPPSIRHQRKPRPVDAVSTDTVPINSGEEFQFEAATVPTAPPPYRFVIGKCRFDRPPRDRVAAQVVVPMWERRPRWSWDDLGKAAFGFAGGVAGGVREAWRFVNGPAGAAVPPSAPTGSGESGCPRDEALAVVDAFRQQALAARERKLQGMAELGDKWWAEADAEYPDLHNRAVQLVSDLSGVVAQLGQDTGDARPFHLVNGIKRSLNEQDLARAVAFAQELTSWLAQQPCPPG